MRLQDVTLHHVTGFGDAYDWRDWLTYQIEHHFADYMLQRDIVVSDSDGGTLYHVYNFLRDISPGHRIKLASIPIATMTAVAAWWVLSPQQLIAAITRLGLTERLHRDIAQV